MNEEILERYKIGGIKSLNDSEMIEILSGKACESEAVYLRDYVDSADNVVVSLFKDIFVKYLEQNLLKQEQFCRSSKEVFDYLYASLRGIDREHFVVLYLNTKNKILEMKTEFKGSLTSSSVYSREIFKNALKYKAAALVFAHNHPSGVPEPSDSDKEITEKLTIAGRLMEIKVLDHMIIGDNTYFSFADNGLMSEYERKAKAKF